MAKNQLTATITIRVSREQKQKLQELAAREGLALSKYISRELWQSIIEADPPLPGLRGKHE